jgi:hypothetical protein
MREDGRLRQEPFLVHFVQDVRKFPQAGKSLEESHPFYSFKSVDGRFIWGILLFWPGP